MLYFVLPVEMSTTETCDEKYERYSAPRLWGWPKDGELAGRPRKVSSYGRDEKGVAPLSSCSERSLSMCQIL